MSIHLVIVLVLVNKFVFSYSLVLVKKKVVDENNADRHLVMSQRALIHLSQSDDTS